MDFKDSLKQIAEKIEKSKEYISTEEATKNAFIMPFIASLGYDVFNPLEVLPEMDCDLCKTKGEKIDYAIMKDGEPIMLIECKHWANNLNLHETQLQRYYVASKARFGVLTNGIIYRFYTDLQNANIMDDKPFLEVDITNAKDCEIEELKKFHKSYFDVKNIYNTANELKYLKEIKETVKQEFTSPSYDFVRLFTKNAYPYRMKGQVYEQFTEYVSRSIKEYINDVIADRLQVAIDNNCKTEESITHEEVAPELNDYENKIVTTEEEIESFLIVKSILRNIVDVNRVHYKDRLNYFNIVLDNSKFKIICRMYLNAQKRNIAFLTAEKEERYEIENLNDIYQYADRIIEIVQKYLN